MKGSKYFTTEDIDLIKKGIEKYYDSFYSEQDFYVKKYFNSYVKFLKKQPADKTVCYFENADAEMRNTHGVGEAELTAHVFGRDAYVIGRAIDEGKKCDMSEWGYLIIDGKRYVDLDKESPFERKKDEFDDDDEALPSIEEFL